MQNPPHTIASHRHPLAGYRRVPVWVWAFLAHEALIVLAYIIPYPDYSGVLHRAFGALGHFWFQWDALWYIAISRYGYAHLPGVPALAGTAFFPWLPVLIRGVGVWGAWGLTQLSTIVSLWLFVRIGARLEFSVKQIGWATFLFALNPAAVYFSTLYAEPWTVCFTLVSVDFGHRQRWFWAALTGLLAATTQATGILVGLFPLVAFLAWIRAKHWRQALGAFLWGVGPFIGLVSYAVYLGIRFQRPLLFASVQSSRYWDGNWKWPWIQWFQGLTTGLQSPAHRIVLALWLAITCFVLGAALLIRSARAGIASAQTTIYGVAGLMVSLSFFHGSSPLYSTVRIASIYFPLYLGIARGPRWLTISALGFFACLAFYGATLFTHLWWYQ